MYVTRISNNEHQCTITKIIRSSFIMYIYGIGFLLRTKYECYVGPSENTIRISQH
jgi:hypothetical protein